VGKKIRRNVVFLSVLYELFHTPGDGVRLIRAHIFHQRPKVHRDPKRSVPCEIPPIIRLAGGHTGSAQSP